MKTLNTYILIKLAKINQLISKDEDLLAMEEVLQLMDDIIAEDRKEVTKHE